MRVGGGGGGMVLCIRVPIIMIIFYQNVFAGEYLPAIRVIADLAYNTKLIN